MFLTALALRSRIKTRIVDRLLRGLMQMSILLRIESVSMRFSMRNL